MYSYMYGGRLNNVAGADGDVAYDYDGLGQRIVRIEDGDQQETHYYWNGYSVVNEYDWSGAEWGRHYLGGLGERAYSGGAYAYYFTDHLGSTLALYDESKDRTGGIDYSPYGTATVADGAASGTTRRYTGHDYDPLTGDYFAPYRFYSPSSHRWLTRDPLGMVDGPNVYGYVGGNPVISKDPSGSIIVYYEIYRRYRRCRNAARQLADDYIRRWPQEDGWGNYMRHCVAMCHLTKTHGAWCAQAAGWWHENWDPDRNDDPVDSANDTRNNRIGVECGKETCPATDSDIFGTCVRCCGENAHRGAF